MKILNHQNNKNINIYIENFSIENYQQYYPMVWIQVKFYSVLQDNLEIIIKNNGHVLFIGQLIQTQSINDQWVGFYGIKKLYDIDYDKYYEKFYQSWSTKGGYFENNQYKIIDIHWKPWENIDDITLLKKNPYEKIISIPEKNLKIDIDYISQWTIKHSFNYRNIISLPISYNKEKILNSLEKIHHNNWKINGFNCQLLESNDTNNIYKIDLNYNYFIDYSIKEKVTIKPNNSNKLINNIYFFSKDYNNKKIYNDSINRNLPHENIHKIIESYCQYQQFNWIISLTYFNNKNFFFIGQKIKYSYQNQIYQGIIIEIHIQGNPNEWMTQLKIKSFLKIDGVKYPPLPILQFNDEKNYQLIKEKFIIYFDGKIKINIPSISNVYKIINHKEIVY